MCPPSPHCRPAIFSGKKLAHTSGTLGFAADSKPLDCLLLVATGAYICGIHGTVTNGEIVLNWLTPQGTVEKQQIKHLIFLRKRSIWLFS